MSRAANEITSTVLTLYLKGRTSISLTTGEILRARVLDVKNEDTLLISMKGTTFQARTEVSLKKGDSIIVKVESSLNQIRLKLIGIESYRAAKAQSLRLFNLPDLDAHKTELKELLHLINRLNTLPDEVRNRLPEIKEISRLFSVKPDSLNEQILKNLTEHSGVTLETKLKSLALKEISGENLTLSGINKDAKALLLKLQNRLNDKDILQLLKENNIPEQSLKKTVSRLIKNIEYHQLQSRLNDILQTYLPLFWTDLRDGELIFRKLKHTMSFDEPVCCFIRLSFEKTGHLITSVLYQKGFIHVGFFSESSIIIDALEKNSSLLKTAFESAGLRLSSLRTSLEKNLDRVIYAREGLDIKA
ncbi:MAG: flagellar hook-length control protein FliK [Nitrospirae bacterium]|nr:flagellar hook-length control protein FliK [Nitrospirota bacterium]